VLSSSFKRHPTHPPPNLLVLHSPNCHFITLSLSQVCQFCHIFAFRRRATASGPRPIDKNDAQSYDEQTLYHGPKWDDVCRLFVCEPELHGGPVSWASPFEHGGGSEPGWTVASDEPASNVARWQSSADRLTQREEEDCSWMEDAQFSIDQDDPYYALGHQVAHTDPLQAPLQLDASTLPDPTLAPGSSSWSWNPGPFGFDDYALQDTYIVSGFSSVLEDAPSSTCYVDTGESFDLDMYEPVSEPLGSGSRSNTTSNSYGSSSSSPRSSEIELRCCKQIFSNVSELRRHKDAIHKQRFHCNKANCYEGFTANKSLTRHVKAVHTERKAMKCPHVACPYAQKGISRKDTLTIHCQRKHGGNCGDG
jgi:hypothetical protein